MIPRNTICLWYDGTALEAATFYAATFADSAVRAVHRAPGDFPSGRAGDVLTVEFSVSGIPLGLANGGSGVPPQRGVLVPGRDRRPGRNRPPVERDRRQRRHGKRLWLVQDRWGLSWQITPRALIEAITDPDRAAAKRAFEAMMTMTRSTSRRSSGAARLSPRRRRSAPRSLLDRGEETEDHLTPVDRVHALLEFRDREDIREEVFPYQRA